MTTATTASRQIETHHATYPQRRDSGVAWLGTVPDHWNVQRLKTTVTACQNGLWGDEPDGTNDILCVRVADFDRERSRVQLDDPTYRALPEAKRNDRLLQHNDLLLEKSGGGEKQPVGAVVLYSHHEPAICSNFIARMPVSRQQDARFHCYLHSALYATRINVQSIKQNTGIQNLDSTSYLNEKVPLPPLPEQQAIATFLDREAAKIDHLIEKKQLLIERLEEKRTALISHAVTKGLDPNVEMKDSGVEWLAKIPAHWQVIANGFLFEERDERGYPDLPLLNVSIHSGVSIREFSETKIEQKAEDFNIYKRALQNDIAFNKMRMWQGAVGAVPEDGLVSPDYTVATPRKNVCAEYYERLFRTPWYKTEIDRHSHGIVKDRNRLYWDDFKQMKSLRPPFGEQLAIVKHLNNSETRIGLLQNKISTAIQRLQEYRTALISAAVTGKIDVRGEVEMDEVA